LSARGEVLTPDWAPFRVMPRDQRPEPPRSLQFYEGIGDRLRAAAFAEIQAREAFLWAARQDWDASLALRSAWKGLALAEDRHLGWLLKRMAELGFSVAEREVSDQLWVSLTTCDSARDFAHYMASAEERGRRAGERFCKALEGRDPETARIFGQIAEEEVAHIELAEKYFPLAQLANV
jgi:uncharacterized ferritin-like protein (DUF455 family)